MYHLLEHSQVLHYFCIAYWCVVCDSQSRRRLLTYTKLTDWPL
jgi:hypothetical protein